MNNVGRVILVRMSEETCPMRIDRLVQSFAKKVRNSRSLKTPFETLGRRTEKELRSRGR